VTIDELREGDSVELVGALDPADRASLHIGIVHKVERHFGFYTRKVTFVMGTEVYCMDHAVVREVTP